MNIFALHPDPQISAHWLCNVHVVKMLAESAEMLVLSHVYHGSKIPVTAIPIRHRHMNHPCTVWARSSTANYSWLHKHALALCQEYWKWYGQWKGCTHDYQWELEGWLSKPPASLKYNVFTPHASAFSDPTLKQAYTLGQYKDVYHAYRIYYLTKNITMKTPMCWPDNPPVWFSKDAVSEDSVLYAMAVEEAEAQLGLEPKLL